MKLYPAILTTNDVVAQSQLTMTQAFETPVVHIDVVDGFFADTLTISPLDFPKYQFHDLQLDVHIMAEEPLDYVYELVSVADFLPIRAVIVQVEHLSSIANVVEEIKSHQWQVGISLALGTDVESIFQEIQAENLELDLWQVMGVQVGAQGGKFRPEALAMLKEIRASLPAGYSGEIILDGGVNPERLPAIRQAGANGVAVGSFLWNSQDPNARWQELKETVLKIKN